MRSEEDLTSDKPLRGPARKVAEIVGIDAIARGPGARRFVGAETPKGADPIVAQPSTAPEIAQLLLAARDERLKVFPAGSSARGIRWDSMPAGPSIVIDFSRMDALVAVDEVSLVVTVQAGMTCLALERTLHAKGFTLGFVLGGFAERVSVGGLLATGLPPLGSPAHGRPLDHVVNVRYVLADGSRVATRITPRSATGPDLDALVLGGRGALAVITEATLRIHRVPVERALLGFGFRAMPDAIAALEALVAAGLPPTAAGVWPASGPGAARVSAKRGARLAALYAGGAALTKARVAAAKKLLKERDARIDPKPDERWFMHVGEDGASDEPHEPLWAHGDFAALARAAADDRLGAAESGFGIPSFDRHGGYAIAAHGDCEKERLAAFVDAGCRVLRGHEASGVPFDAATLDLLRRLKTKIDPDDVLNPGALGAAPLAAKEAD